MIHYTIVPDEQLYEGIDKLKAPEQHMYRGVLMQIERLEDGRARIVRLLSPNPANYLDPELAPGRMIRIDGQ